MVMLLTWLYPLAVALYPLLSHTDAVNVFAGRCFLDFPHFKQYAGFIIYGNFILPFICTAGINCCIFHVAVRKKNVHITSGTVSTACLSSAESLNFPPREFHRATEAGSVSVGYRKLNLARFVDGP